MLRPALLVCLLLSFALVGCSGGKDLARAEHQIGNGNLEVAEGYLAGKDGPEADRLRARIATMREQRESIRAAIEATDAVSAEDALGRLEDLRGRTKGDPIAREWVAVAISDAHDRAAVERRSTSHAAADFFVTGTKRGARSVAEADFEAPVVEGDATELAVLDGVFDDARRSMDAGDWKRALATLEMAVAPNDGAGAELRRIKLELRTAAREDMDRVLAEARRLEDEDGMTAALEHLQSEAQRFARGGDTSSLFDQLDDLRDRVELIALAEAAEPGALPEREFRSDAPLHIQAGAYERVGELSQALDLWTEAALAAGPGDDRDA